MNKKQLSLLITHTIAITNQAFSIQCGEFATALAGEEDNNLSVEDFDLDAHMSRFDYQSVLDSGYKDMPDLSDAFDQIAEDIEGTDFDHLVQQLPTNLPVLTNPISGEQLKAWVAYALTVDAQSPLYQLHQLFSGDSEGMEDSVPDLIRQAIAFDDLDELQDITHVTPKDIKVDDLNTAATIQSFKVFEWMVQHAKLSNKDVVTILSEHVDSPLVANTILPILKSASANPNDLLNQAKALKLDSVYDFLKQAP